MKKYNKKIFSLILVFLISTIIAFPVYAGNEICVYLDNEKIQFDVEPLVIDGRTMVPMRAIFEQLGAVVDWNNDTRTAIAKKDDVSISISINDSTLYKIAYDDETLKNAYNDLPEASGLWLKAQHILIQKTDDGKDLRKAEEILSNLRNDPSKFEEYMYIYNEDPGVANFPDGYVFCPGMMVDEFFYGALKIKEGDISDIVETEYGFHIIKKIKQWNNGIPYEEIEERVKESYLYNNIQEIKLDVPARLVEGRTLVPLRAVSEAFDCDVQWDGDTQTVNIYSKDRLDFSVDLNSGSYIDTLREIIMSNASTTNGNLYKIGAEKIFEQGFSHYTALVYDAKSDEIYIEVVGQFADNNTFANLIFLDGAPEKIKTQKRVMYLFMESSGKNTVGNADINPSEFRDGSSVLFHYYNSPHGNLVKSEDQELCTEFTQTGLREANQLLKKYGVSFDLVDLGFVYFRSY